MDRHQYEAIVENPVKLEAYRKTYGYNGDNNSCPFCGLNLQNDLGQYRRGALKLHMRKCHPEVPDERYHHEMEFENETAKTSYQPKCRTKVIVVNTTQQLYRPTQSRLRGVS